MAAGVPGGITYIEEQLNHYVEMVDREMLVHLITHQQRLKLIGNMLEHGLQQADSLFVDSMSGKETAEKRNYYTICESLINLQATLSMERRTLDSIILTFPSDLIAQIEPNIPKPAPSSPNWKSGGSGRSFLYNLSQYVNGKIIESNQYLGQSKGHLLVIFQNLSAALQRALQDPSTVPETAPKRRIFVRKEGLIRKNLLLEKMLPVPEYTRWDLFNEQF